MMSKLNKWSHALAIGVVLLVLASGCVREELPVPKYVADAQVQSDSLSLGNNYDDQIFYSLDQHRVIARYPRDNWDLAFEANESGVNIILNDAKTTYAYEINTDQIKALVRADTSKRINPVSWDASSHNPDSLAIGKWNTKNNSSYIIDCGKSVDGKSLGMYKVRFLSVDVTGYNILVSQCDNDSVIDALKIPKREGYTYTYLNLRTQQVVEAAPPAKEWDVLFSLYTHTFYEPYYTPYLVLGCLLNPYNTKAASCNLNDFDAADVAGFYASKFSSHRDAIGYDWKTFDRNLGQYAVDPKKVYFIESQNALKYKIHFVDFTNSTGIKGHPKWEFQEL